MQQYVFRSSGRLYDSRPHVATEYWFQSGEELIDGKIFLGETVLVDLEVELGVIILVPLHFGVDVDLLDAAVSEQHILQRISPDLEVVVVVAEHLDAVGTSRLAHVVAESVVLQSEDRP